MLVEFHTIAFDSFVYITLHGKNKGYLSLLLVKALQFLVVVIKSILEQI